MPFTTNKHNRIGTNSQYAVDTALYRAERTPGAVAVSGIDGRSRQDKCQSIDSPIVDRDSTQGNTPAGIPETNSLDHLQQTCADTSWAVLAECQDEPGKIFAKRIYCGKEWCPVCGTKRSRSHNRKIARVLPKAMQISTMGYFVIEFPDRYRKIVSWAYSRKAIDNASKKIKEVFAGKARGKKRSGYFDRGLMRWHWFGDKIPGKWNPHCNVLVDGGYIPDMGPNHPIVKALKDALNCPDLIVHYSYAEEPGQKFQRVEYITRATFLKYSWNPYMANQLYGFRNQRWWGKWEDLKKNPEAAVWHAAADQEADLLDADTLEASKCPDCGGDLVWTKPFNAALLDVWGAEEVGETGYYRVPAQVFDGHHLTPEEILRLDKLRIAADEIPLSQRVYGSRSWAKRMSDIINGSSWGGLLEYMDGEYEDSGMDDFDIIV